MATDIQICSDALVELGGKPIATFSDNDIARSVQRVYVRERATTMRQKPWRFMSATVFRTGTEATDALPMKYEFNLPNGFVRLWRVADAQNHPVSYAMNSGNRIFSDVIKLRITYTTDITEANWPDWFADLMLLKVKARIAYARTNSRTMEAQCKMDAAERLREMSSIEAMEHEAEEMDIGEHWLAARY